MRADDLAEERFGSARILIIDADEPGVRSLETILARAGYASVTSTTDPQRGFDLLSATRPDVVLLDMHMFGGEGCGSLEQVRREVGEHDFVPIVVLADERDRAARVAALRMGAQDLLTKPFDAEEVALRCRNVLATRFLHEELETRNRSLDLLASSQLTLDESRIVDQAILASLEQLEPGAPPEQIAEVVCAELATESRFDIVGLIAFGPDGSAVTLSTAGPNAVPGIVGRPIGAWCARMLIERAARGSWFQRVELTASDGTHDAALAAAGIRSALYAPLGSNGQIAGLLVVGFANEGDDASFAARLPTVARYAAVARALLMPGLLAQRTQAKAYSTIVRVIEHRAFDTVFQPVVHLADGSVIGFEALTRFRDGVRPDLRFAAAHDLGLGIPLEEACLAAALSASDGLPLAAWVGLNISPSMVMETARLQALIENSRRVPVFEITEHVRVPDYDALRDGLKQLGNHTRVAIDDAGAGYASFHHIVELQPDYVKIDSDLVRSIDSDFRRQALVTGLRYFGTKTGCTLIAEGVETDAERAQLHDLGVLFGQGYLLGRPAPVPLDRADWTNWTHGAPLVTPTDSPDGPS